MKFLTHMGMVLGISAKYTISQLFRKRLITQHFSALPGSAFKLFRGKLQNPHASVGVRYAFLFS